MMTLKQRNINSFAITSKDSDLSASRKSLKLAKKLNDSGFDIKLVYPLQSKKFESISLDSKSLNVHCIISVGGDGTIIKTSRLLKKSIPILGLHAGGKGILTEIKPDNISNFIKHIRNNDFFFDRRKRISVSTKSQHSIPSLNEVYIERSKKLRAINYQIKLDSSIFNYRMDGLLVSTPTGSTGHSLSLGSSMLSEKLSALLITPIAPISRLPPIAIPISDFSIIAYENARVVVDGQVEFSIEPMEEIKINTKVPDVVFLRFSNSTLRQLTSLGF
ncbi:MAG: hypothetical protein CMO13_01720 [Thaumarchaeota archaeon]|nr:hypothetical protein [Nitrososphaerota archaeon]|tara:strand:- start:2573 stop:3397 length:825 start_codon:yes stop_codon:yes gene_type:complete